MLEFVPLLALALLIKKAVDAVKAITNGEVSAVVTQVLSAAAGVAVLFLAAQTDWADGIVLGGQSLASLNGWALVFVGITLSTAASTVKDVTSALDNSDSAKTAPLLK